MALNDLVVTINRSGAGVNNQQQTTTVAAQNAANSNVSVAAATAGTLTTRTDANTGVITLSGGHGLTNGTGDVFWNDMTTGIRGSRRGMTWTIVTNALTIDGGSGDDLPATSTIMTVMKPVSETINVDGDNAKWSEVYASLTATMGYAYIAFLSSVPADLAVYRLLGVGGTQTSDGWLGASIGISNPFAGETVQTVTYSHGETSALNMGAILAHS